MTNSVSYSTLSIDRFRGLDYATGELNMSAFRSPDMMNLIPYENGALRSRNGYECVLNCEGRINGIYNLTERKGTKTLIHHGNKLSEWSDHKMYRYVVPDGGLEVLYRFTVGENTYNFSHLPLQTDDELSFTADSAILKINDTVVPVTQGGTDGTVLKMEESSESGVYHAKQKIMVFTFSKDTFKAGLDYFCFDSPYKNKYIMWCYFGISYSDIPENGLTVTFVDDTSKYESVLTNGAIKTGIAVQRDINRLSEEFVGNPKNFWCSAGTWTYRNNLPGGANYGFLIGEEKYYFQNEGLQANDEVKFDGETKYLYLNGKRISTTETMSSQTLEMEEYISPLIELSADFPDRKSTSVQMANSLYIFTGDTAYVYGGEEQYNDEGHLTGEKVYGLYRMVDKAYVPTVRINASPVTSTLKIKSPKTWIDNGGGGGTNHENVNLLTDVRLETFCVPSDTKEGGKSTAASDYSDDGYVIYYKLPLLTSPITKVNKIERLDENGDWISVASTEYSVDNATGIVTFNTTLYPSAVSGKDNYRVEYTIASDGGADIKKKSLLLSSAVSTRELTHYKIYRFYLGRDIDDLSDGLDIQLNFDNLGNAHTKDLGEDSYVESGYNKGSSVNVEYARTKATYTGSTSYMFLPNGNPAADSFRSKYQDENGYVYYYAYWQIYSKLINEEGRIYLEVSQPFYWLYYIDETDYGTDPAHSKKRTIPIASVDIILTFTEYSYKDRINKASICTKFGASGNVDRVFVAGWDKMREYEFWSEIDNPLYFPDLNYACLGDEDTAVMGWSRINNNQMAIHKSGNGTDPTIYIQSADETKINDKTYYTFPVTEGPAGEGVVSQRAFGVLGGEPLALGGKGVFATRYVADVAADVRYAVPRSYYINPKLAELNLSDAEAVVFNNRYYLAVPGGMVFVADGSQKYAVGGDSDESSYEWFCFDNVPARIWWINEDRLYFGTADGRICRFNDGFMDIDKPVKAYWTSPWLDFGTQTYYKKIKNVVLTCTEPRTDFSEVNIDYITKNGAKTVKSYLIDNTSRLGVIPCIATNRKVKKITGLKVRVRSDNAEDFGMMALSFLYIVSGKYKG